MISCGGDVQGGPIEKSCHCDLPEIEKYMSVHNLAGLRFRTILIDKLEVGIMAI